MPTAASWQAHCATALGRRVLHSRSSLNTSGSSRERTTGGALVRGKIRSVGLTDVGRVREHNEDTIGVDADIGLFVLADGMGGYKAGEVASGITVRTVMGLLKEA